MGEYTPDVFDSIHGRLARAEPARIAVEVGGFGYALSIPLGTYEGLPPRGSDVRLLVHLVIREDEWRLFGFLTEREREIFRALLGVTGVGPMTALALLSGLKPSELSAAVGAGDIRTLTRVKGVGRKTAERIVVELRDVLGDGGAAALPSGVLAAGPEADAVAALLALGLDAGEAARRVAKARAAQPDAEVAAIVRAALRL